MENFCLIPRLCEKCKKLLEFNPKSLEYFLVKGFPKFHRGCCENNRGGNKNIKLRVKETSPLRRDPQWNW